MCEVDNWLTFVCCFLSVVACMAVSNTLLLNSYIHYCVHIFQAPELFREHGHPLQPVILSTWTRDENLSTCDSKAWQRFWQYPLNIRSREQSAYCHGWRRIQFQKPIWGLLPSITSINSSGLVHPPETDLEIEHEFKWFIKEEIPGRRVGVSEEGDRKGKKPEEVMLMSKFLWWATQTQSWWHSQSCSPFKGPGACTICPPAPLCLWTMLLPSTNNCLALLSCSMWGLKKSP